MGDLFYNQGAMSLPRLVERTACFFCVILVVQALANPARGSKRETTEDYDTENEYDPDWFYDYDPWENPPCPNWNPIDGCGRTPARTKPPVTTAHPNERTTPGPGGPSTLKPNSHKLVCTEEEIKEAACLHGGQCFAIKLLDARSALCQCSEQYTGTRCEQLDDSFFGEFLSADKVTKASIAAGVLALVIILVVIIVYLVIKKRKQRKARAEANGQANGHAGKALIADKDKGTTIDEDEKCTDV